MDIALLMASQNHVVSGAGCDPLLCVRLLVCVSARRLKQGAGKHRWEIDGEKQMSSCVFHRPRAKAGWPFNCGEVEKDVLLTGNTRLGKQDWFRHQQATGTPDRPWIRILHSNSLYRDRLD